MKNGYWSISPLDYRQSLLNQYSGVADAMIQIEGLQMAKDLYKKQRKKEDIKNIGKIAAIAGITALTGGVGAGLLGGLGGGAGAAGGSGAIGGLGSLLKSPAAQQVLKSPELFGSIMGDKKSQSDLLLKMFTHQYGGSGSLKSVFDSKNNQKSGDNENYDWYL